MDGTPVPVVFFSNPVASPASEMLLIFVTVPVVVVMSAPVLTSEYTLPELSLDSFVCTVESNHENSKPLAGFPLGAEVSAPNPTPDVPVAAIKCALLPSHQNETLVEVDAIGLTCGASENPVGHVTVLPPVPSWVKIKFRIDPAVQEASVELPIFPVKVATEKSTTVPALEDGQVKVGVAENATLTTAAALPGVPPDVRSDQVLLAEQ